MTSSRGMEHIPRCQSAERSTCTSAFSAYACSADWNMCASACCIDDMLPSVCHEHLWIPMRRSHHAIAFCVDTILRRCVCD